MCTARQDPSPGLGSLSQAGKWPWKFRAETGGSSAENTQRSEISASRKKLKHNKPGRGINVLTKHNGQVKTTVHPIASFLSKGGFSR